MTYCDTLALPDLWEMQSTLTTSLDNSSTSNGLTVVIGQTERPFYKIFRKCVIKYNILTKFYKMYVSNLFTF